MSNLVLYSVSSKGYLIPVTNDLPKFLIWDIQINILNKYGTTLPPTSTKQGVISSLLALLQRGQLPFEERVLLQITLPCYILQKKNFSLFLETLKYFDIVYHYRSTRILCAWVEKLSRDVGIKGLSLEVVGNIVGQWFVLSKRQDTDGKSVYTNYNINKGNKHRFVDVSPGDYISVGSLIEPMLLLKTEII